MERLDLKLSWLNYAARKNPSRARLDRAPIYRLVDRVGRYFVPIAILIAIVISSRWFGLTSNLSMGKQ